MITCDKCGSQKITYYKQKRSDGVLVVTARCENWHSPIKGKPFFPAWQYNLEQLPLLPIHENSPEKQLSFFEGEK